MKVSYSTWPSREPGPVCSGSSTSTTKGRVVTFSSARATVSENSRSVISTFASP